MPAIQHFARCCFLYLAVNSSSLAVTLGTADATKWNPTQQSRDSLYGYRIAYSQGTVLVGQPGYDNHFRFGGVYRDGTNYGAAHVYSIDEQGNRIATTQLNRSGGQRLDNFGTSVAIDENLAVVGALWADDGADASGTAWLFERDNQGAWNEVARLASSSPQFRGEFSKSVAVSGRIVVVGAPNEGNGGLTYIFSENDAGQWIEQAKIEPPVATTDINFGTSVALFQDTLVIGADRGNAYGAADEMRGAAFVFERSEQSDWNHVATLGPGDPFVYRFGASASLWEDTLAVGATHGGMGGTNSGSVYVFRENADSGWTQVASFALGDQNDDFGSVVSVRDGSVLVGASSRDLNVPNRVSQGAAYLYREAPSGNWVQVAELISLQDSFSFDLFGESVALADGLVIVGAPRKKIIPSGPTPTPTGAVYVFVDPVPEPSLCCHLLSIMLVIALRRRLARNRRLPMEE